MNLPQNVAAWKTIRFLERSGGELSHGSPHMGPSKSECQLIVGNTKNTNFFTFLLAAQRKNVRGLRYFFRPSIHYFLGKIRP